MAPHVLLPKGPGEVHQMTAGIATSTTKSTNTELLDLSNPGEGHLAVNKSFKFQLFFG